MSLITNMIPIILCVPLIVVAGGQVEVGIMSRILNKVIEVENSPIVSPVLAISSPVATGPAVASVPIAGGVLVVHVVSQTLHGVSVQDVGEAEGVAELRGVGEVGAVVPALALGLFLEAV